MKNFKEIAEKCLAGELSGTFVLHNGDKRYISKENQTIRKDYLDPYSPYIIGNRKYSRCGVILPISNEENPYDIVDFIPDQMVQTKIEIDIPEGKVPVMEQTEKGVVITWKEKELTYDHIIEELKNNSKYINTFVNNPTSRAFYKKAEVLRKLTNIRNYFGKPDDMSKGWCITYSKHYNTFTANYINDADLWFSGVLFKKGEHAEQAIKMLGDELKYLFEPW